MADNRMFLCHRPSGLGVMLGKRFGSGWYKAPETKELEKFYIWLETHHFETMEDLVLLLEVKADGRADVSWNYTAEFVDGFRLFEFNEV